MENGEATHALDLNFEDSQSHAPPPIQNGMSTSDANGNHPVDVEEEYLEADDTSVEGDVSASVFDPESSASGLQVDPSAFGEEDRGTSLYAFSTYPRIQAAFQVEHPFDTMLDSATM
jgi:hypothetical protein